MRLVIAGFKHTTNYTATPYKALLYLDCCNIITQAGLSDITVALKTEQQNIIFL
jgi:hypothetical protein